MANVTITPNGKYVFGSKSVNINAVEYILQDFSITRPAEVTELNGSQGETIAVVAVQKLEELSGTFVKESGKPDPSLGMEFDLEGKTYFITETSESRSNGEFATLSFSAREKLSA
jgi:hypothetical protein